MSYKLIVYYNMRRVMIKMVNLKYESYKIYLLKWVKILLKKKEIRKVKEREYTSFLHFMWFHFHLVSNTCWRCGVSMSIFQQHNTYHLLFIGHTFHQLEFVSSQQNAFQIHFKIILWTIIKKRNKTII